MSKYTTEVRFICENALGLTEQGDYTDIDKAIECGRKKIFNFDYELFDEDYKRVIETKFLRHFYTREIGFETVALWKLKLQDKWIMKLQYYNALWKSALLEFNPLNDVDYTIDHAGDGKSDRTDNLTHSKRGTVDKDGTKDVTLDGTDKKIGSVTTDGTQKKTGSDTTHGEGTEDRSDNLLDKYSDTPQGELNGVINTEWLTNARQNVNTYHTEYENDGTVTYNNQTKDDVVETYNVTDKKDSHDIYVDDFTDTYNLTDTDTGTQSYVTTDNYLRKVVGKMSGKSYSELLRDYRKTFINIDEMFINEMNDLFMLIY